MSPLLKPSPIPWGSPQGPLFNWARLHQDSPPGFSVMVRSSSISSLQVQVSLHPGNSSGPLLEPGQLPPGQPHHHPLVFIPLVISSSFPGLGSGIQEGRPRILITSVSAVSQVGIMGKNHHQLISRMQFN